MKHSNSNVICYENKATLNKQFRYCKLAVYFPLKLHLLLAYFRVCACYRKPEKCNYFRGR